MVTWQTGSNGRALEKVVKPLSFGRTNQGDGVQRCTGVQPSSNPLTRRSAERGTVYKTASTRRLVGREPDLKARLGPGVNEGPCSWSAHTAAMRLAAGVDIDGRWGVRGFRTSRPSRKADRCCLMVWACSLDKSADGEGGNGKTVSDRRRASCGVCQSSRWCFGMCTHLCIRVRGSCGDRYVCVS